MSKNWTRTNLFDLRNDLEEQAQGFPEQEEPSVISENALLGVADHLTRANLRGLIGRQ